MGDTSTSDSALLCRAASVSANGSMSLKGAEVAASRLLPSAVAVLTMLSDIASGCSECSMLPCTALLLPV